MRLWVLEDNEYSQLGRRPSVGEVVVWLREQGAGFTAETWERAGDYWLPVEDSGTYLVIPLDTEPPKEEE